MDSSTFINFLINIKAIPEDPNDHQIEVTTKLIEGFDQISNAVNFFTNNQQIFNQAIIKGMGHPTIQQTFNSLIFGYIAYLASDEFKQTTDLRNEFSHIFAKTLVEAYEKETGLPFMNRMPCI